MKLLNHITSAICMFMLMVMISCTEEPAPIAVTSVTLDSTSMTLVEGDTQKLTATISPSNAENKAVIWTSNNSSVASVKEGTVTALKEGEATITAKSDDGGKTATCKVTVNAKAYPVESVSLDKTSYEMTEGDEFTLTATVKPDNATNKNVTWSSSNTSVATVNNGKVTALKAGTATITVKTEDGGKTATCEVTVNAKVYPVESVSLDKTSYEMTEGDEFTLTATVKPDNATNKNVTWSSSNTSVATVNNGKVTALKAGTATITVKTEDGGKTATCEVTVNAKVYPVESVSLDKTSYEMTEGDEFTLTATVKPDNATNKNVTWSSSNTSVATVNNGKVTALKAGTATITVKTEDGGKTATCEVTVNAKVYPVESVSLDKTSYEMTEGDEFTLTATVKPDNATNKNVTWSSSNTSVATVNNGKVTALKAGTATITVKTEDGGKTATCEVTVNAKVYPVESVSLDKTLYEMTEGDEFTLTATVKPDNATNKNVTWSSNNTSVATVSNGKVTAMKAGTATITVKTEDGGKTAICNVMVIKSIRTDLSSSGTANSYIVSEAGTYKFTPTKGNSSESVGSIASAVVLWETFGTDVTPNVGDLVKNVKYENGVISFETPSSYKEGNAVIAAKDASGKILWSWHIWLTDQPEGQVYYKDAGAMMDRNLGATSAIPGDVGALGLLYQWGRKDPFLGSSSISSRIVAESTITWPSAVSSDSSNGTISYATANPTTFIMHNDSNYDWYYTGSLSTDNTRWTTSEISKSIYDPCPAGWRVPDGGDNGVWSKACGSSSYISGYPYDGTNEGMNFSGKFGSASTIWYPASGCRTNSDGGLFYVGNNGYYWSASPYDYSAYYLGFNRYGSAHPSYYNIRSYGQSVRCVQE